MSNDRTGPGQSARRAELAQAWTPFIFQPLELYLNYEVEAQFDIFNFQGINNKHNVASVVMC